MEIILVLGIVGILASALYPNIKWYLDRAHDVEIKNLVKDWITLINNYKTDKWGLHSQPDQINEATEIYCVGSDPDCPDGPEKHVELDQYIRSITDGQRLLDRRDAYCEKITAVPGLCSNKMGWIFKESPAGILYEWWYILPGKDPLDTTKKWEMYYYLDGKWTYYNDAIPDLYISWNNMPIDALKRCSPWIPTHIYSAGANSFTECLYIFED